MSAFQKKKRVCVSVTGSCKTTTQSSKIPSVSRFQWFEYVKHVYYCQHISSIYSNVGIFTYSLIATTCFTIKNFKKKPTELNLKNC